MEDYKDIVSKVDEAVREIKDQSLKEIAFKSLLDDALQARKPQSPPPVLPQWPAISAQKSKKSQVGKSPKVTAPFSQASVRNEVKQTFDDVDPNMPGIRPLKNLKQKWEKYLWVLEVARRKGLDILTNSEVAYVLLEKFSYGVTEKQVNNLTFKVQAGYVQKRKTDDGLRAWRILQGGIDLISGTGGDE